MIVTRITIEDANGEVFGYVTYPDQNGDVAVHVASPMSPEESISLNLEEIDNLISALEQARKVAN